MHIRFVQPALFAGVSLSFSFLLVYSASAIDPMPDNTPGVTPTPTVAPIPTIPPLPTPPPTPTISQTPEVRDDLIPPPPATPPPQETPSPSPLVSPPPMPSIPPTPGPINPLPDVSPPPPPPPPPPLETPTPEPHPTLPPIYPPPVPTAPPIRQGIQVGPSATVVLPTAEVAVISSVNRIFELVALPQDQIVLITVHYASTDAVDETATGAAQLIRIQAIDGGQVVALDPPVEINGSDLMNMTLQRDQHASAGTADANGNFTFIFQTGHLPGLYQIRLHRGNEVLGMQFWIRDPQNPANDPPAIAPAHNVDIPSPNPI